jgi:hypothetical protein
VTDASARLADARVERTATGFRVTTAWVVESRRNRRALATSDDGFATATYTAWTDESYAAGFPFYDDPRPGPPNDDNYLLLPVPALDTGGAEGTSAYVMGGDGSTLLSFERVARSTDGGESWDLFDVPRVDGALPYIAQAVAVPDGGLLALVPGWSNDRGRRPGPNHHGLWASQGPDWGRYTPYEPAYSPPLTPEPRGLSAIESLGASWSRAGEVIWSTTWDGRLYVSTDDGLTFSEIAPR